MRMDRVRTGVVGLDEMLNGGFPSRRSILVCGGPGSGKTLLGINYLYFGASEFDEKGVFISLEEDAGRIIENVKSSFPKWEGFEKLVDKGDITIVKLQPFAGSAGLADFSANFETLADTITSYVTQRGVKRVVIDSATIIEMLFATPQAFRRSFYNLLSYLTNLDATVLFTAELPTLVREESSYTLEQFIADGVIYLYNLPRGEKRIAAIEVLKMRGTAHSKNVVPLKFTPEGIEVYPEEKVY